MGKILFIINPGASGGQGDLIWEKFRSTWPDNIDPGDVKISNAPGHAKEIAASTEGYDILATVGGDGTTSEIMNGIMDRVGPNPSLAIIPAGTGNDIARSLGLFPFERAVEVLGSGTERSFDLIKIEAESDDQIYRGYSLLAGAMGFSATSTTAPWVKRFFGPTIAYYFNTARAIMSHRSPDMSIRWEDHLYEGRTWMVIVSNVESISGGSMRIAPGAQPDDGLLWITVIESGSKLKMMTKVLPKVAAGKHLNERGFHFFPTDRIEIESDVPAVIDVDGEMAGAATRATISIVPKAIRIVTSDRSA